MAERSTLQRRPGSLVNRIIPTGWVPTEGTHAFCLGSDEPGWTGRFNPGDGVEMAQAGTFGSAKLVRLNARLRGPASALPSGWRWEAYALVNGDEAWAFEAAVGRTIDFTGLLLSLYSASSPVTLAFGVRAVGPGSDPEELELPAFYFDELVLDTAAATLMLANQYPEPNGTGLVRNSKVLLELVDPLGSGADLDTVNLSVDGVLAVTAGVPLAGYTFEQASPLPGVLRLTLTAPYLFDSQRTVQVGVSATTVDGERSLSSSYSFQVEDKTAPGVLSVWSYSPRVLRVRFTEAVRMSATEGGALVLEGYEVVRLSAPAVDVVPVDVQAVGTAEVDLVLDTPITKEGTYQLFASGVLDTNGNELAVPYNQALFSGFEYPAPARRRFQLLEMVPQLNRAEDATGELEKFLGALQEALTLILYEVDRWPEVLDVDVAEEKYLDQMLIRLGNPFSFTLSVDDKRRLIRLLVSMYRQKGTDPGIVNAIRFFLGLEVSVVSFNESCWILGQSQLDVDCLLGPSSRRTLYSFKVVSPIVLTEEQRRRIRILVAYMKPAWTHHVATEEPVPPEVYDHVVLGVSRLNVNWILHGA